MEEIIDVKETNFNKTQSFFILPSFLLITITLLFLLITITLLVAVSIYCYPIKYQAKNLLPFHNTNNKLNKFCVNNIN